MGPRGGGRGRHGFMQEGFGREGRGRMRRGDIRTAVLVVLDEAPRHGYEVIQALEEKTQGAWRPSPGSVYPTLQLLEDEGLARSTERDGKRVYEITAEGHDEASKRVDEAGLPWEGVENGGNIRPALMQLMGATRQIGMQGKQEQIDKAVVIINDARKALYQILAED